MLAIFFLLVANRKKERRSVVVQYKPRKSQIYALQYSDQVIKFFDAVDLEWVEKETPWRHPRFIEQRKKAFRLFNQKSLVRFVEIEQGNRDYEPYHGN
jgi:hypothetical protein